MHKEKTKDQMELEICDPIDSTAFMLLALKEKLAQLPAVDMQLAFVHKGNLHVNCRQLSEFFFQ